MTIYSNVSRKNMMQDMMDAKTRAMDFLAQSDDPSWLDAAVRIAALGTPVVDENAPAPAMVAIAEHNAKKLVEADSHIAQKVMFDLFKLHLNPHQLTEIAPGDDDLAFVLWHESNHIRFRHLLHGIDNRGMTDKRVRMIAEEIHCNDEILFFDLAPQASKAGVTGEKVLGYNTYPAGVEEIYSLVLERYLQEKQNEDNNDTDNGEQSDASDSADKNNGDGSQDGEGQDGEGQDGGNSQNSDGSQEGEDGRGGNGSQDGEGQDGGNSQSNGNGQDSDGDGGQDSDSRSNDGGQGGDNSSNIVDLVEGMDKRECGHNHIAEQLSEMLASLSPEEKAAVARAVTRAADDFAAKSSNDVMANACVGNAGVGNSAGDVDRNLAGAQPADEFDYRDIVSHVTRQLGYGFDHRRDAVKKQDTFYRLNYYDRYLPAGIRRPGTVIAKDTYKRGHALGGTPRVIVVIDQSPSMSDTQVAMARTIAAGMPSGIDVTGGVFAVRGQCIDLNDTTYTPKGIGAGTAGSGLCTVIAKAAKKISPRDRVSVVVITDGGIHWDDKCRGIVDSLPAPVKAAMKEMVVVAPWGMEPEEMCHEMARESYYSGTMDKVLGIGDINFHMFTHHGAYVGSKPASHFK